MDMDLGMSSGLGINSTSPSRPNPMRSLIHNGQVVLEPSQDFGVKV